MERNIELLRVNVGRNEFANPLLFGGGTCKTLEDVQRMIRSDAAGGEVGTITPLEKLGNKGPKTFYAHFVGGVLLYTLNSLGLPNPGKEKVSVWARQAIEEAHAAGKKLGINIAADTVEEIVRMVHWAIKLGFDWITINAGCPNKYDDQNQPLAVLGFDEKEVGYLMRMLDFNFGDTAIDIWWKPPPYSDTVGALARTAQMIADTKAISGYIANNTVGHCFCWGEDGEPTITPGGGLAGMGGPAVKPIALGHIRRLDKILPPRISRIGAGGVVHGSDMSDYRRAGAVLVHAASVAWAYPERQGLGYGQANRILAEHMETPDLEDLYSS